MSEDLTEEQEAFASWCTQEGIRFACVDRLGDALADLSPGARRTPLHGERDGLNGGSMAERRQLTAMFIDLVGSTALALRLDPEEMGQILTAYRNAVTGELSRPEGHVAKLMGDGVSNVTQRLA